MLVQSHGDNDHIGGLQGLIGKIPVSRVISSVPGQVPLLQAGDCVDGQSWSWDGVHFQVLHPGSAENLSANDRSCVVRVKTRNGTLLLSGDIEKKAERSLLLRHGEGLQADVLVVPITAARPLQPGSLSGPCPGVRNISGRLQESFRVAQPGNHFPLPGVWRQAVEYGRARCDPDQCHPGGFASGGA